jgi:hypothetical protein
LKVYSVAHSTNCERIALAAGHKRLELEWIEVPYDDRSEIERVSGRALVPVLVDGDRQTPCNVSGRHVRSGQRPLKSGLRFSTNAVSPSVASSEARAR